MKTKNSVPIYRQNIELKWDPNSKLLKVVIDNTSFYLNEPDKTVCVMNKHHNIRYFHLKEQYNAVKKLWHTYECVDLPGIQLLIFPNGSKNY